MRTGSTLHLHTAQRCALSTDSRPMCAGTFYHEHSSGIPTHLFSFQPQASACHTKRSGVFPPFVSTRNKVLKVRDTNCAALFLTFAGNVFAPVQTENAPVSHTKGNLEVWYKVTGLPRCAMQLLEGWDHSGSLPPGSLSLPAPESREKASWGKQTFPWQQGSPVVGWRWGGENEELSLCVEKPDWLCNYAS